MSWLSDLDTTLAKLRDRGWLLIHRHIAPPVAPTDVATALQRYPDLDADVLEFYAACDGAEVVVGKPRRPQQRYATIEKVRERSQRFDGRFGTPAEIHTDAVAGPSMIEEFGDDVHSIELLPFSQVMDPHCDNFEIRDGDTTIHLVAWLGYSTTFGLTRAEEIRRWRQPVRTRGQLRTSHRPGYRDHDADFYQAALRGREQEPDGARTWWALGAEDHCAALDREPPLRWSEMLAGCLRYLEDGDPT